MEQPSCSTCTNQPICKLRSQLFVTIWGNAEMLKGASADKEALFAKAQKLVADNCSLYNLETPQTPPGS